MDITDVNFLKSIDRIITDALLEDIGDGDVTSNLVLDEHATAKAVINSRQEAVICGLPIIARLFDRIGKHLEYKLLAKDGDIAESGQNLMEIEGTAHGLFLAERTALNLMQHLSGIATNTKQYVDKISHTKAKVLDTRKTTPCLRMAEKYAVFIGGGINHRMCLDDGIMIKDNHIHLVDIETAISRAQKLQADDIPIIVECDNFEQAKIALKARAGRLLLDNMTIDQLKEIVEYRNERYQEIPLEASGGINLETISDIAETGVDFISVGALTHSATHIDIGMDML